MSRKKKVVEPVADENKIYIPTSIMVYGRRYKIKVTDSQDYLGLCDSRAGVIYLSKHQTAKEAVHTLIHEIIHAWQFRTGLNQAVSRETLEIISEGIATFILESMGVRFKTRAK